MAKDYSNVRYQPTEDPKRCCNKELLKTFLLFFDLIIIFSGLALIGIGVYLLISRKHYTAILANEVFFLSNYIILGAGVIVLGIAILGLVAVCKSWPRMLYAFTWLLGIVFTVEAVSGVLALIFIGSAQELLVTRLRTVMQMKFGRDEPVTGAINDLQVAYRCCGAISYHDWEDSAYIREIVNRTGEHAPESCCKTRSERCARSTHPSNINHIGCVRRFAQVISKNLTLISIFALAVALIQLLGVIIGCCLYREYSLETKRRQKPSTFRTVNGRRGEIELQKTADDESLRRLNLRL